MWYLSSTNDLYLPIMSYYHSHSGKYQTSQNDFNGMADMSTRDHLLYCSDHLGYVQGVNNYTLLAPFKESMQMWTLANTCVLMRRFHLKQLNVLVLQSASQWLTHAWPNYLLEQTGQGSVRHMATVNSCIKFSTYWPSRFLPVQPTL